MELIAFIAVSLDGYIARPDGGLDWLPEPGTGVDDCGFSALLEQVDTLVMGRRTFEQAIAFGEWPYGALPVVVVSRQWRRLPSAAPPTARLATDLTALVASLAGERVKRVYVDGGQIIRQCLQAGLLTEITVTTVPVVLGEGIALFDTTCRGARLAVTHTRRCGPGLSQTRYRVIAAPGDAGCR